MFIYFLTFVKTVRLLQALLQFFYPNFGRVGLGPTLLPDKPHGIIDLLVCYSSWAGQLWRDAQVKGFNHGTLSLEKESKYENGCRNILQFYLLDPSSVKTTD